jgi:hypothetical protein
MTMPKVTPIIPNPTKILLRYFDLSWANVSLQLFFAVWKEQTAEKGHTLATGSHHKT